MRVLPASLAVLPVLSFTCPAARADAADLFSCNVPAGYYRIVDLEGAGTVSLHADHSDRSQVLGTLHAGDIVFSDGTRGDRGDRIWQRIKPLQTTGWVQARNLHRALPLTLGKTDIPVSGWCGAFSPLWSIRWEGDAMTLSLYPGRHDMSVTSAEAGAHDGSGFVRAHDEQVSMTLIYSDEACRSETGAVEGWGKAQVLVRRAGGAEQLFTGCCKTAESAFVRR